MSFVTDAQLETRLAAQLKQDSSSLPSYWDTIITDSRNAAYQDILTRLMSRGYTLAQITAWDRGSEFEIDIGLYWCLTKGAGLDGANGTFITPLDRRQELDTITVIASNVVQTPGDSTNGMIGRGVLDTGYGQFKYDVDGSGEVEQAAW